MRGGVAKRTRRERDDRNEMKRKEGSAEIDRQTGDQLR